MDLEGSNPSIRPQPACLGHSDYGVLGLIDEYMTATRFRVINRFGAIGKDLES